MTFADQLMSTFAVISLQEYLLVGFFGFGWGLVAGVIGILWAQSK